MTIQGRMPFKLPRLFARLNHAFNCYMSSKPSTFPGHGSPAIWAWMPAKANLIAFLDADDLWHPQKLKRQLELHHRESPLLSVCGYYRFNAADLRLREIRVPSKQLNFKTLLAGNTIPLSTVVANRESLLSAGGFHPERHEDYGLWLRLFSMKESPNYLIAWNDLLMAYLAASSINFLRRGIEVWHL